MCHTASGGNELTPEKKALIVAENQLSETRKIKNILLFFAVLAVIGIVASAWVLFFGAVA